MAKDKIETEPNTANDIAAALMLAVEKMTPAGLTGEQLEKILEGTAKSTRKALKPENDTAPDVSAFNPRGERDHPRPRLRRKTYWAGAELHHDELTLDEIELFNQVEHTVEARHGSWRAELKRTGSDGTSELHVTFPCRNTDDRMDLPSMALMMRELLGGTKAVDPISLAEQVAELQQQLKQLSSNAA